MRMSSSSHRKRSRTASNSQSASKTSLLRYAIRRANPHHRCLPTLLFELDLQITVCVAAALLLSPVSRAAAVPAAAVYIKSFFLFDHHQNG